MTGFYYSLCLNTDMQVENHTSFRSHNTHTFGLGKIQETIYQLLCFAPFICMINVKKRFLKFKENVYSEKGIHRFLFERQKVLIKKRFLKFKENVCSEKGIHRFLFERQKVLINNILFWGVWIFYGEGSGCPFFPVCSA